MLLEEYRTLARNCIRCKDGTLSNKPKKIFKKEGDNYLRVGPDIKKITGQDSVDV